MLRPAARPATAGGRRRNEQDGRADGVHGPRFLVLELDGDYGQDGRENHEYMDGYEKKRNLGYVREGMMREGGCVCHMHGAAGGDRERGVKGGGGNGGGEDQQSPLTSPNLVAHFKRGSCRCGLFSWVLAPQDICFIF